MNSIQILIYALLWLSFGCVHSLLARASSKRILEPLFGRAYRFGYNLIAALHIGFVIIGGEILLAGNSSKFELGEIFSALAFICQVIGIVVIVLALTRYHLGRFSGITQLFRQDNATDDEDQLQVTGIHGYVRHPLYLGVYLYLWGGAVGEFGLQTALWGSLYLCIGTWFEERSLVAQYGRSYIEYKQKVPAIFPFKGRAINK